MICALNYRRSYHYEYLLYLSAYERCAQAKKNDKHRKKCTEIAKEIRDKFIGDKNKDDEKRRIMTIVETTAKALKKE